ncbi:hypothetical protein [Rhodothermus marinus]|uniref:Uncharacterized protein n=1 Tax=Rhodothermus marinus (strain ATCC 43812 / DSM 4252 / R-10) TaxID=518766 RepID=D0MGM1_RHOM4|nr:hypothetical protein [Rhodothermus marinus]ACY49584.1 hypothetical protein Rmar_2713 [Rhodothermus marinus DSM 4252]
MRLAMRRRTITLRRLTRAEAEDYEEAVRDLTLAERIALVWPLTVEAWSLRQRDPETPAFDAQSRLPRHIVRLYRRRR